MDWIFFRVRFYLGLRSLQGAGKGTDDRPVGFQLRLFNDADSHRAVTAQHSVLLDNCVLTKSVYGSEKGEIKYNRKWQV